MFFVTNISFAGKSVVYSYHATIDIPTLIKSTKQPLTNPSDDNMIIHGDNLHALKALLPRYASKIDCVYIDPPYNTGNEGWAYNDNVNHSTLKWWVRQEVTNEDMERHDKWMCMMWPRLSIIRELLADDGIIFVSIDDHEQHRLRCMMDEIFGEDNFYAILNWTARTKPMNAGSARFKIQKSEEYILVYGTTPMHTHEKFVLEKMKALNYNDFENGRQYRLEEIQQRKNIGIKRSDKMVYSILGINPRSGYRWTIGSETSEQLITKKEIVVRDNKVFKKIFKDAEDNFSYHPFWANFADSVGSSESGKSDLEAIIKNHGFETVKPVQLIEKLLFHCTKKDSVVLDSFAGSGTTAQAVLSLNKKDGGNRKFILIEMEDYALKTTAERVKRVIKGVENSNDPELKKGLGGSFAFYTLGKSIGIESMLKGGSLPDYDTLARHLLYNATGISTSKKLTPTITGLFYSTDYAKYYLLYEPNIKYLQSSSILNEAYAKRITDRKKRHVVFAAEKYLDQKTLSEMNIEFCRIPDTLRA